MSSQSSLYVHYAKLVLRLCGHDAGRHVVERFLLSGLRAAVFAKAVRKTVAATGHGTARAFSRLVYFVVERFPAPSALGFSLHCLAPLVSVPPGAAPSRRARQTDLAGLPRLIRARRRGARPAAAPRYSYEVTPTSNLYPFVSLGVVFWFSRIAPLSESFSGSTQATLRFCNEIPVFLLLWFFHVYSLSDPAKTEGHRPRRLRPRIRAQARLRASCRAGSV